MTSTDQYATLASPAFAEIKILGSRFLAYAEPAPQEDAATGLLQRLRKEHHAATHHCNAWRIGSSFHYSDDGEPTGTAGKRILGAIDRKGLVDTAVVVVRYYGGVKLGTGGLARAYAEAADAALDSAEIAHRFHTTELSLEFAYDLVQQVHHGLDRMEAEVLARDYADSVRYRIRLHRSREEPCRILLEELTQNRILITPPL